MPDPAPPVAPSAPAPSFEEALQFIDWFCKTADQVLQSEDIDRLQQLLASSGVMAHAASRTLYLAIEQTLAGPDEGIIVTSVLRAMWAVTKVSSIVDLLGQVLRQAQEAFEDVDAGKVADAFGAAMDAAKRKK